MRTLSFLTLSLCLLVGCSEGPPPEPVDPVPAGVVIPKGMPNDKWFHEHVLSSKSPVLVDFTAIWCPPCQIMKPDVHKVEKAYGDRLKVVEVDFDEHEYLSAFFRVKYLPRLISNLKFEISNSQKRPCVQSHTTSNELRLRSPEQCK